MLILKHWSERQQPAGILSGNRGRWVPSSCPPCLLKAGRCHFFSSFTFSFSFFFLVAAAFTLPLCIIVASGTIFTLSLYGVFQSTSVSQRETSHKPDNSDFIFGDQVIAAAIHNILRFPGSGGQGNLWSRSHGTIITRKTVLGNYLSRARQKIANWNIAPFFLRKKVCLLVQ